MLGILYDGTTIEGNFWKYFLNHSAEEEPTRNSIPWNKKRSKLLEFPFEACLGRKLTVNSVC
jgi:hypothetical protein